MGENPEENPMHYHRIDVYARDGGGFVPLSALGKNIL